MREQETELSKALVKVGAAKFIKDFAPLHADGKTKVTKTQVEWAIQDALAQALSEQAAELRQLREELDKFQGYILDVRVGLGHDHDETHAKDFGKVVFDQHLTIAALETVAKQRHADLLDAAKAIDERNAEITVEKQEVIRMAGLVAERDAWLPQEERIALDSQIAELKEKDQFLGTVLKQDEEIGYQRDETIKDLQSQLTTAQEQIAELNNELTKSLDVRQRLREQIAGLREAFRELLQSRGCWFKNEPEIAEEISAQFDITLDLARKIIASLANPADAARSQTK